MARRERTLAIAAAQEEIEEALDFPEVRVEIMATCVEGEQVFFKQVKRVGIRQEPTTPGQIYSYPGLSEFRISGWCEHHFDDAFRDDEEREDG